MRRFTMPAIGLLVAALAVPTGAEAQYQGDRPGDIVEVAAEAGTFETLLAAAEAAGLVATLQGEGPLTVFAPNDAAFEKLPDGTVEALLNDTDKLRAVLTYHVVPGRIMASDVIAAGSAMPQTAQGQKLNVRTVNGMVRVDDATVVAADVEASNGVIHVIDSVLIPSAKSHGSY